MAKQGERLTKRLAGAALASALAVVIAAAGGIAVIANGGEGTLRNQVVELNDARQEIAESAPDSRSGSLQAADQALASAQDALRDAAESSNDAAAGAVALTALVSVAALAFMAIYLHRAVARPFTRLEGFAEEVAAGNLEAPLAYERSNPFGKFTWAFDQIGRAHV